MMAFAKRGGKLKEKLEKCGVPGRKEEAPWSM
jgi:hypothetical protein